MSRTATCKYSDALISTFCSREKLVLWRHFAQFPVDYLDCNSFKRWTLETDGWENKPLMTVAWGRQELCASVWIVVKLVFEGAKTRHPLLSAYFEITNARDSNSWVFQRKSQEERNNIHWFVQGMRANDKSWPRSKDGKVGHDPFSPGAQKPVQERNTSIVKQIITPTLGVTPQYQAEGKRVCDPISKRHNQRLWSVPADFLFCVLWQIFSEF